jgi:hypothetical protein
LCCLGNNAICSCVAIASYSFLQNVEFVGDPACTNIFFQKTNLLYVVSLEPSGK